MQAGFFLLFHSCCILPCWCQLWVVNWISKVSATSIGTLMCIHHKHSMAIWIKSMNSNRIPGGEPSGQQFFRLAVANTSKLHMIRMAADGYSSTPGMPCVTWTEIARLRGIALFVDSGFTDGSKTCEKPQRRTGAGEEVVELGPWKLLSQGDNTRGIKELKASDWSQLFLFTKDGDLFLWQSLLRSLRPQHKKTHFLELVLLDWNVEKCQK